MPRVCQVTGKRPVAGNNVSHAHNKTRRRFLPNLKKAKFTSELLKRSLTLTVSNAGVRSVDKKGTFDQFLKTAKNKNNKFTLKRSRGYKKIDRPIINNWQNKCVIFAKLEWPI